MKNNKPVILIDIGGTLLTSEGGGGFSAIKRWLVNQDKWDESKMYLLLAKILHVESKTIEEAFENIVAIIDLTSSQKKELKAILSTPITRTTIVAGAIEIIETAKSLGWKVCTVTNVTQWTPELPKQLSGLLEDNFKSHRIGHVKQETSYWTKVTQLLNVDPSFCLVIGDDSNGDFSTPTSMNFPALLIGKEGLSLKKITEALSHMGPIKASYDGIIAGKCFNWANSSILKTPYFANFMNRITRKRIKVINKKMSMNATIIRSNKLATIVQFPGTKIQLPLLSWVKYLKKNRSNRIPEDLRNALQAENLSIDNLPEEEKRYLISLIAEAKEKTLRNTRLVDIVNFLKVQI